MFCSSAFLILVVVTYAAATPVYNETNVGAGCTISSFSQVDSVVKSCNNIVIQGLTVPAGKQLLLNLKSGTHLTFSGTTNFGYGTQWEGPMLLIKGDRLTVTGGNGKLEGNGAHYWDGKGDKGTKKPKFFRIQATSSTFSNIHLANCPHQCVSILNSQHLTLSGWNVDVSAGDRNQLGHNTDGFDISSSDDVEIKNSVVKNQDDCVAVNSGNNYRFSNLQCSGGHGLSLSIGVNPSDSSKNRASNIVFSDCTVSNSRNGIHVKTHTDAAPGSISDVTYRNIKLSGITNYGINVQQDYKGGSSTGKPGNNIPIKGLTMSGITGTMTGSNAMGVYILCGSSGCSGFNWSGVSISGAHKSNSCNYHQLGQFKC